MKAMLILVMLLCIVVMGCDRAPSPEAIAEAKAKKEVFCRDHICEGDVLPKHNVKAETVLKLNNQFFIGPKEYFSRGTNGAAFFWPSKVPAGRAHAEKDAPEFIPSGPGVSSNFYDVAIEIFLRSTNPATDETTRQLLEKAETQGWIASRTTLRPGLEQVKLRRDPDVPGSMRTLYIATKLKGEDGLAPVALCNNDQVDGRGGTAFIWQPGIMLSTRWNQKHCADWPEIYQEIVRVLSLVRGR